jgi:polyisoprenoid-binding protein YceI
MKTIPLIIAASCAFLGSQAHADTFTVDPEHTMVQSSVERLGYSQTLGFFRETSGEISFDETAPQAAQVNVTIPVASLDTNLAGRDAWIKSEDMLNGAAHPEISFVSTGIEVTGENTELLTGDLTMNGMTNALTLDVMFNRRGPNPLSQVDTVGFSATGTLMRSEYGVAAFLGPLGDEITIEIQLEALIPAG